MDYGAQASHTYIDSITVYVKVILSIRLEFLRFSSTDLIREHIFTQPEMTFLPSFCASNKVFSVASRRKFLPTHALVSFYPRALYQEKRCKQSVSCGSIDARYSSVIFALRIYKMKSILLLDFKFTVV